MYKNMNNKIMHKLFLLIGIMLFSISAQAQIKVNGTVVDPKGEPVIGATVFEAGTKNAAVTDFDGNFVITVAKNATLHISSIGYQDADVKVNGRTTISVTLVDDETALEEVVVVGYGQQKKESVIGAISQVSSKDLLSTPAANVSQAIAGKIPGVVTAQTSGAPGADDAKIYIRGRATFAGDAQPLILVDGVERSFSQIAPDDIETISVLKDASATAVYGVRGANGVMLITTKRGKEQKPVVSLTANFQWQSPTRKDTYLNSYESVKLLNEAYANDGLGVAYSDYDVSMFQQSVAGQLTGANALLYPNVDWYDEVLKSTAPAQRYNASVRGGTKRMRYYASLEYYNQGSLFKNLSRDAYGNSSSLAYNRYAFRANADFFLTKDLTLSVNFGTRFEERQGPNANESDVYSETFYELNHAPGWVYPVSYKIPNGETTKTLWGGNAQYQNNIVGRLSDAGYYKGNNTINETNFIVDYKMDWLTKGLSAKAMMSFDYENYHRDRFTRGFATYEPADRANYNDTNYQLMESYHKYNTDTNMTNSFDTSDGSADKYAIYKLYMEAQLNYARTFNDVHDVTAMVLYMQNDYRNNSALAQRYQGVVGRITYGYAEKYYAEFNAGYNGSENFASGKRFGFFPAFSVGWRLTNEKFMESTKNWLTNLKLRASYGQVGNDKYLGDRFLYEQKWSQIGNDYYFGTTGTTGIFEQKYPNVDVTWERAHKYNFGVEFNLWSSLLTGNIDIFYEKRNDILTEYLTRPEWVGVTMAVANLGKTKNSGMEIELKHMNHIGKDFFYNIGLTFSHAKNEIISMDEPALKTDYRKREGRAIGQYFGLVADGFVTQADIDSGTLPKSTFAMKELQPGDLKYRDMNNDGFIDDRDETFIGYSDVPENTYALTLGANYKDWGFSVMFQGVDHVSRYYDAEAMFAFINGGKVKEHHLGRWNPSESEAYNLANATYPLLHYAAYGDHNQRQNSFFLKNGAFVRLKNVELFYNLPAKWINKVGMSSCRLYVNANNLITWDHLDDLVDPESNGSNRYPICKTVNFGLNVTF